MTLYLIKPQVTSSPSSNSELHPFTIIYSDLEVLLVTLELDLLAFLRFLSCRSDFSSLNLIHHEILDIAPNMNSDHQSRPSSSSPLSDARMHGNVRSGLLFHALP